MEEHRLHQLTAHAEAARERLGLQPHSQEQQGAAEGVGADDTDGVSGALTQPAAREPSEGDDLMDMEPAAAYMGSEAGPNASTILHNMAAGAQARDAGDAGPAPGREQQQQQHEGVEPHPDDWDWLEQPIAEPAAEALPLDWEAGMAQGLPPEAEGGVPRALLHHLNPFGMAAAAGYGALHRQRQQQHVPGQRAADDPAAHAGGPAAEGAAAPAVAVLLQPMHAAFLGGMQLLLPADQAVMVFEGLDGAMPALHGMQEQLQLQRHWLAHEPPDAARVHQQPAAGAAAHGFAGGLGAGPLPPALAPMDGDQGDELVLDDQFNVLDDLDDDGVEVEDRMPVRAPHPLLAAGRQLHHHHHHQHQHVARAPPPMAEPQAQHYGYGAGIMPGGPDWPAARVGPGLDALAGPECSSQADPWSEDEEEEHDTTADQYYGPSHKDLQGIPWERLQFSREHYRETRLKQYRNYTNLQPEDDDGALRRALLPQCVAAARGGRFLSFVRNSRSVQSNIVHFQLRNLVWASSRNDVFVVHDNVINHWSPVSRRVTEVLNLAGGAKGNRLPGLGRVQVSTMCVRDDLVAAGGFTGELVVKRLSSPPSQAAPALAASKRRGAAAAAKPPGQVLYAARITNSDNGITNGLEIFASPQHGTTIMCSNNDAMLRLYSAAQGEGALQLQARWPFPWAVNYATVQPDSHLAAVVGDDPATMLTDVHNGVCVARLEGHKDYSFAAAWHPGGHLVATGNQDTTALVWDVRNTSTHLARLPGRMGAIRALRFTGDGRFLAMSEPADFVHVYDVASGFQQCQEIDFFGEIAGISFTPLADCLFVGVSDLTYASLMQFERTPHNSLDVAGFGAAAAAR